ncbi:MAG: mannose-1-phosphate guanylyltransferase [Myxococcales bacterium]|nr:mannose-1-phosphate guanylyltransferase [Myxococcales bacterium]
MPLLGTGTLFDETLARLSRLSPPERCWVVSARSLGPITKRALRAHPGVRLLLEPIARNTAAAIAWAAARIVAEAGPKDLMAIFPADHHIPAPAAFARTVRRAARAAAAEDCLVLIGIEPTRPDTGYGYIQVADPAADAASRPAALRVRRFLEKPSAARARRFLRAGSYLWNAGMVVGSPRLILEELERHSPEVWAGLGPLLSRLAAGRRVAARTLETSYRRVRPISFDFAVLERSRKLRAVRGTFRWSDLGSWDALAQQLPERDGNRVREGTSLRAIEAAGNLVWTARTGEVALLGVSGLAVIETDTALLVCPLDRAQEVRRLAQARRRK